MFALGSVVEIRGLKSKVEYNGRYGAVVSGPMCDGERVSVQFWSREDENFEASQLIQIRPANLIATEEHVPRSILLKGRADEIIPNLFVGDCLSAEAIRLPETVDDPEWLQKLRGCRIVCCAEEITAGDVHVPLKDTIAERIEEKWDDAINFIVNTSNPILVHCVQGRSRSAAIAIAAVVKSGFSLLEAWDLVKSRRPQVAPNTSFIISLLKWDYERELQHDDQRLATLVRSFALSIPRLDLFLTSRRHDDTSRFFVVNKLKPFLLSTTKELRTTSPPLEKQPQQHRGE